MASQDMRKYRKIKPEERKLVTPGQTLYFDDGSTTVAVDVVKATEDDCIIILDGKKITTTWQYLKVLD